MKVDLSNQSVAVVGGSGFIGKHVVDALMQSGAKVRNIDIRQPQHLSRGVDQLVGDIKDEAFIASGFIGVESVICLASSSLPATANSDLAAEIEGHVQATVKMAEIANRQGVRRFIFASSGGTIYGRESGTSVPETAPTFPLNAYGVSKLAIEHYLRVLDQLRDIQTISMRVANPFGPGQRATRSQGFVAAALEAALGDGKLEIWGDGSVIRDFVYVEDVARAFACAAGYEGEEHVFNIGSGCGSSLVEVVEVVSKAVGITLTPTFSETRNIDVVANVLDIARATQELQWVPETSFATGIKLAADWLRDSGSS